MTGDDCVSIQTGCSGVNIQNVDCGPGHGISIGSLGKDNTKACVSNITVSDTKIHDTLTGVRIKTWQVKGLNLWFEKVISLDDLGNETKFKKFRRRVN